MKKYYSIAILLKNGKILDGTKLHKDREEMEILQKILLEEFRGRVEAIGIIEENKIN